MSVGKELQLELLSPYNILQLFANCIALARSIDRSWRLHVKWLRRGGPWSALMSPCHPLHAPSEMLPCRRGLLGGRNLTGPELSVSTIMLWFGTAFCRLSCVAYVHMIAGSEHLNSHLQEANGFCWFSFGFSYGRTPSICVTVSLSKRLVFICSRVTLIHWGN